MFPVLPTEKDLQEFTAIPCNDMEVEPDPEEEEMKQINEPVPVENNMQFNESLNFFLELQGVEKEQEEAQQSLRLTDSTRVESTGQSNLLNPEEIENDDEWMPVALPAPQRN